MWNDIAFTFPLSLESIFDSASDNLSDASNNVNQLNIDLLDQPYSWDKSDIASSVTDSDTIQENLAILSRGECRALVVHPYIYKPSDVQRNNLHAELTPPSAIEIILDKLNDIYDSELSDFKSAICFSIQGKNETQFATNLSLFNNVFPMPELEMVERRAKQLSGLETEKIQDKAKIQTPYFDPKENAYFDGMKSAIAITGTLSDLSSDYDIENTTPKSRLSALLLKKKNYLDTAQAELDDLKSVFSGGQGKGIYFSNFNKSSLTNSGFPSDQFPLCAMVLLMGSSDSLTPIKQGLGL